jgi:hypothetical protein
VVIWVIFALGQHRRGYAGLLDLGYVAFWAMAGTRGLPDVRPDRQITRGS